MVINAEYSEALPFLNGKAFAYDDQGNIEVLELKYFEYIDLHYPMVFSKTIHILSNLWLLHLNILK